MYFKLIKKIIYKTILLLFFRIINKLVIIKTKLIKVIGGINPFHLSGVNHP